MVAGSHASSLARSKEVYHIDDGDFLGIGLSSRKNLCIHPSVRQEKKGKAVDARCRDMTSSVAKQRWEQDPTSVELCEFHEVGRRHLPLRVDRHLDVDSLLRGSLFSLAFSLAQNLGELDPDHLIPYGVHTIEDMKAYGQQHKICPYFAIRRMVRLFAALSTSRICLHDG